MMYGNFFLKLKPGYLDILMVLRVTPNFPCRNKLDSNFNLLRSAFPVQSETLQNIFVLEGTCP